MSNEWISVKDRLPEPLKDVLCTFNKGAMSRRLLTAHRCFMMVYGRMKKFMARSRIGCLCLSQLRMIEYERI